MTYYYSPFRSNYAPKTSHACPFCANDTMEQQTIRDAAGNMIANDHYRWIINTYPKFDGHTMLVPREHLLLIEDESDEAVLARHHLTQLILPIMKRAFPDCGIEYFLQTGSGSESSLPHLHWHLVPASPTDPLRSFEKLGHFYTTVPEEEKVVIFPKPITMSPEELLVHLQSHT